MRMNEIEWGWMNENKREWMNEYEWELKWVMSGE